MSYDSVLAEYLRQVTGAPSALQGAARILQAQADALRTSSGAITDDVQSLAAHWSGDAASAYRQAAFTLSGDLDKAATVLDGRVGTLGTQADALQSAQSQVETIIRQYDAYCSQVEQASAGGPAWLASSASQAMASSGEQAVEAAKQVADQLSETLAGPSVLDELLEDAVSLIGKADYVAKTIDATVLGMARARWTNALDSFEDADRAFEAMSGAALTEGEHLFGKVVAPLALGADSYEFGKAVNSGDLAEEVHKGGNVVFDTAALAGGGAAAVGAGIAWEGGTLVGQGINKAMEGTEFGDRFQADMDAVYSHTGDNPYVAVPAGMVAVPFAMAKEGVTSAGDAIADGYRYLTGSR